MKDCGCEDSEFCWQCAPHAEDCECSECVYCRRIRELERQADIEAAWQRDVIGPLLGFEETE